MTKFFKKFLEICCIYLQMLKKRDETIYIFGSWYGEKFADNPKFLYLYYLRKGKNVAWVTKNTAVYNEMKTLNFPVYLFNSKEGKEISKKAKYFFYCCSLDDITKHQAGGAILINLWHGIPLKKIMYDDTYNYNKKDKSLYSILADIILSVPYSKKYLISTSRTMSKIYEHAFRLPSSRILNLGQPRNDCFFDGTLEKKNYAGKAYSKLVTYLPTMRDMGKEKIEIDKLFDLNTLDDFCQRNNVLFLIKKHFCHRDEKTDLSKYNNIVDLTDTTVDTQELLYNTDLLITDYSSCFIDYMLLDRPIVFFAYDLDRYLKKDREMYFDYKETMPGPIVDNYDELIKQIDKQLKDKTALSDKYSYVKSMFYDIENQNFVSENIMKAVDNL